MGLPAIPGVYQAEGVAGPEVRRRPDLGQEPLGTDDGSQLGLQDFEGDSSNTC